jgi:transposase
MEEPMQIDTEVIEDVVLLVEQIKRMGLAGILDEQIERHWKEKGLSWGWTISIWLVHIISQGDHRKLPVRDWVRSIHETLEMITGLDIQDTDFTDDRLTIALRHLSNDTIWHGIEEGLCQNVMRVYKLKKGTIRVDATTVSGYREGEDTTLWQFGHSKDDPALRQIKIMMATIDPLGFPIALDVVEGQHADDPLYLPVIKRVLSYLEMEGLLFVGDCKMSAIFIRAYLQQVGQHYLMPLAHVGETAKLMPSWIQAGVAKGKYLIKVSVKDGDDDKLIAEGYEVKRTCKNGNLSWEERVFVARSPTYAEKQRSTLEKRLDKAKAALLALTPPVGRGRQQITDEDELIKRASACLSKYDVRGLLTYTYEQEKKLTEQLVGRGRSGPDREKKVVEHVRYQITGVQRCEQAISSLILTLGWRAYATNASNADLSFESAIIEYRNEYIVEHGFGRFKGMQLQIAPMFVKRDDQVKGMTRLLSIAVGILTLMESVARRSLQQQGTKVAGLYQDSPRKETDRPTSERLLRAFAKITLTKIYFPEGIIYHVTPLKHVQQEIIALLGFSPDLYASLARIIPRNQPVAVS